MQVVVISGGSSGIGLSCVNKFLSQGDFVYNLDIVNNDIINPNYKYLETDFCNPEQVRQSIKQIIVQSKQINSIVVSAGKHLSATIENTSDEDLMDVLRLNLLGAFWFIQAVIPYMKEQNDGAIVTIGSDQCTIAKPSSSVYGMTKAALGSLTKSTAIDYARYNIRVNCIGAGSIDTPLHKNAVSIYSKKSGIPLPEVEKEEAMMQPIGRIGNPDEVAELVYFLTTKKASFMNGAIVPFDGGYTAR